MKDGRAGQYLLWYGIPSKIIGEIHKTAVIIENLEDSKCPHCGESLGKKQLTVILGSPLYQENAKPMPTIDDDDSITIT